MKKYIFLSFINTFLFQSGYGQLIRPLDKGLQQYNSNIQAIYSYENDAYVATNTGSISVGSNFEYSIKIAKWNGISWSYLPTLRAISSLDIPTTNYFIKNMCVYKEELYISGMFDSISGLVGSCGIIKWNGSAYQSVGGGLVFSDVMKQNPINASEGFWGMVVWRENLVIAAEIKQAGTKQVSNMAMWNGGDWSFVGKSAITQGFINTTPGLTFNNYFKGIGVDNVLILHGTFTSVGGNPSITGLSYCSGNDSLIWNKINPQTSNDQLFYNNVSHLISYPKNINTGGVLLYSSALNKYGEFNSITGWRTVSELPFTPPFQPKTYGYGTTSQPLVFWHKGTFWALGSDNYFYKDLNSKKSFCKSTGFIPSNSMYVLSNSYLPSNIILGGISVYGNDTLNNAGAFLTDNGILSGRVYIDQNNNCLLDNGEPLVKNALISNGSGFVSSNQSGVYSTTLPKGKYTLQFIKAGKHVTQVCPVSFGTYTDSSYVDSIVSGYDFALKPNQSVTDLQLTLIGETGWRARRGFTENYLLKVQNLGTLPLSNFSVYLQLSAKTAAKRFNPQPTLASGTVYRFDIPNLTTDEVKDYSFSLQIPGSDSVNIGDSILLLAYFSSNINEADSDLTNNSDTLVQTITSAYDPNDKQSNPFIYVFPNVKKIDYQIRFQNLGTDTAYGVTVLDTVDMRLPLKEITINAASHPYRFAVINNVLFWRFDLIMLPPIKTDEPRSKGWIRYSSKLAQGLPIGTEILNKAYIYFDYEKAVITNEALIRLVQDTLATGIPAKPKALNETIRLFPNPAGSFFVLENTGRETEPIEVYSLIGEKIQVMYLKGETQLIVNTIDWKNGVYFIKSSAAKAAILVIQH
jgi:hypothetical protein